MTRLDYVRLDGSFGLFYYFIKLFYLRYRSRWFVNE